MAGFTLIEMMVFLFIFSLSALTFYKMFTTGTQAMGNVRSRLTALELDDEKMEVIRNLDYEKIGTTSGIPHGDILQDETVVRGGKNYYVHVTVIAQDDPFDGTAALGTDAKPEDYKQIRVRTYWEKDNIAKSVTQVANISPPGLESIYTGGILSLHVVDNAGAGIPQARIILKNSSVTPTVDLDVTTDNDGNLFLPEAKAASQTYSLEVSKNGYFPVKTYAPYPISSVAPVDVHASVVEGAINQKTIVTDKVSVINVLTKSPLGDAVPNIDFDLAGGRKIADTVAPTPNAPQPVWAFSQTGLNSGTDGKKTFDDMSSGPYYFTYKNSANNANYELLQIEPNGSTGNSINVPAGVSLDMTAILADKQKDSLLVTVLDNADNSTLANANVELKNSDASYDVTLVSDNFGQAYFPNSAQALPSGDYQLSVSLSGFQNVSSMNVHVDKFTKQEIKMNAD